MLEFVYFVVAEGEIVFASLDSGSAEGYAEEYNSSALSCAESEYSVFGEAAAWAAGFDSGIAVVGEVAVPVAVLGQRVGIKSILNNYEADEIFPTFSYAQPTVYSLNSEPIDISGMKCTTYIDTQYVYIEDEEMWYMIDTSSNELVLPSYDISVEIEHYVDVLWENEGFDEEVIVNINGKDFTRADIYFACLDYLK